MDGQFHAIEFDPSATADEVLKLVKAKIGLRDSAQGKLRHIHGLAKVFRGGGENTQPCKEFQVSIDLFFKSGCTHSF